MVRAEPDEARVLEEQAALRGEADALAALVERAGWSLAPAPGDQARSFLGRLIGGAADDSEAAPDPVAVYLDSAGALDAIAADVSGLAGETRDVARRAAAVAGAPEGLARASLERDIAAAEGALGAVRRARAFFLEVETRIGGAHAPVAEGVLALKAAETALAEAADALAERRWAGRGDALSG
ncbi:MAG: hypothetical protein ACFE0P_12870 [Oceanicaulis sp.]